MTWKSYVAVSGATVVAGWLASAPPSNEPAATASARATATSGTSVERSDIEQQAARLQARGRTVRPYAEPHRNPFRFAVRGPQPDRESVSPAAVVPTAPPVERTAPAAPPVSLSGIAEDQAAAGTERTAVLSSPEGVLLVREGDEILGRYRVARIESEAVELISLPDGATVRLTLR